MVEWVDFLARATDRHHLTRPQILTALAAAVYDEPLPDQPTRYLELGDDTAGETLEIVLVPQIKDRWLVIHAIPLRYRLAARPHRVMYDSLKGPRP